MPSTTAQTCKLRHKADTSLKSSQGKRAKPRKVPHPPPPKECVVSNAGVCSSLSSTHTLLALYFEQGFARGLSTRRRECPSRQRNPKCTSLGNVLQHECEYEELVLDLTNWVVPRYNLPCKVRARASRLYGMQKALQVRGHVKLIRPCCHFRSQCPGV